MAEPLRVDLLGGVEVSTSTSTSTPGRSSTSPRAVSLLAYLVSHPGIRQPRAHLAVLLWPDSQGQQARTNLRRELHHLRTLVGDSQCLEADGSSLRWRRGPNCVVDVHDFLDASAATTTALADGDRASVRRHSDRALDVYRGPFLPGCDDDWCLSVREDLRRTCLDLCDHVADYWLSCDDPVAATAFARRRVVLEPWEELGYLTLMQAQRAAGDRSGAMRTYHRCASVLESELGVEPSPQLRAELTAVLSDLAPGPGDAEIESAGLPSSSVVSGLVGRENERGRLLSGWGRARSSCQLVVVLGEAGVGKTRLVAEMASAVRKQGGLVVSTRCFAASRGVPLAPVADWLHSPPLKMATMRLDPVWRAEVSRLVPDGDGEAGPGSGARAKVDAWQRSRFFEGLVRAFLAVDRPVLLTIDDLQWCDRATMAWLTLLVSAHGSAPLYVVATARDEEIAAQDPDGWLDGMRRAGHAEVLRLGNLSAPSAALLAQATLGREVNEEELVLLMSTTSGNPLFLLEVLRESGATPGPVEPADVRGVLDHRLSRLSEPAREVVTLAACVGRDFTLDLLIEACDLGEDVVVRQVDDLWRRRILEERGRGYDFAHDLLREAAYRMISPPRRWLLHRRLAQALQLLWPDRLDEVAAQLADQYDRGGQLERALPFYERAARRSTSLFAHGEAVRFWQRALALLRERPASRERDRRELDVLQELLPPLNAHRGYASIELERHERRAEVLGEGLGRTDVRCTAAIALFATTFVQGHTSESHAWGRQALTLSAQCPELTAQAHLALAGSGLGLGRVPLADEHFRLACDLAGSSDSMPIGTRTEVHARAWWAHARWLMGDVAGARAASDEAIRSARGIAHPYSLTVALSYAALTHQLLGDLRSRPDLLSELTHLCAHYDFAYYRQWAMVFTGWAEGGPTGLLKVRGGIDELSHEGSLARMPYWLSLLADLHHDRGDVAAQIGTLDAAASLAAEHDDVWWLPEVLRARAALDPMRGPHQHLDEAAALARSHSSATLLQRCRADLEVGGQA